MLNTKLEPLAFATLQVQELRAGATTKEDGTYALSLQAGTYHIVVSMVGYETRIQPVLVTTGATQNLILEEAENSLSTVVVNSRRKDVAEELIRNVIRQKEKRVAAAGAYTCQLYIKATQQNSGAKARKTAKQDTAAAKAAAEFEGMALAEITAQLAYENSKKFKEVRSGVRKEGTADRLFYTSATDGFFNFYDNLVKVPTLSQTPFISPVSYGGLLAYRFKTISVAPEGTHKRYTISVRPRSLSNATVSGELVLSDSDWTLREVHIFFPKYHLPEYDQFELTQKYMLVNKEAWLPKSQTFAYASKAKGGKLSGTTVVTYQNYVLHKTFPKNYFGNEVSATAAQAYERDSLYWQTARAVPLTAAEIKFIRYRDSLYTATHTAKYLDSVEKEINRVTFKKLAFSGQNIYNRSKERTWTLPSLVSLYQPFAFGGSRLNAAANFQKTYARRQNISFYTNLSYGFRNQDINGNIRLSRLYNPFNRGSYTFAAGRDFQFIYQGDAWINLLKRSNVFLNQFLNVGHSLELVNGLFFFSDAEVAFRRSLSGYKIGDLTDSLFGNTLGVNQPVAFQSYNAVYAKLRLEYTPGQRYLREPKEKIILGSAWPTFYAAWRGGVPHVFNSNVQFQFLEFGLRQQLSFGLLGRFHYHIKTGRFIDTKELKLIDYHFQRRGDPLLFLNPDEAFQALDSTFPLFRQFHQAHVVHEFNGALLNKIPLLKKAALHEVAGGGFLLAPERHLRYGEAFAGVERVFRWPFNPLTKFKLGVYVVGSAANQFRNPVQFKIGITSWDALRNRWF